MNTTLAAYFVPILQEQLSAVQVLSPSIIVQAWRILIKDPSVWEQGKKNSQSQ